MFPSVPIKDPITRAPDIVGPHGQAWRCDIATACKNLDIAPEDQGCLVQWIIEAPWAHPAWHSYMLVLVHLRPLPVSGQIIFHLEGATHELWLYALNADKAREPAIAGDKDGVLGLCLSPKNFGAQIKEASDEAALSRIEDAVRLICKGELSPDTDFLRQWIRLFGDNMVKPEFR
jgi:hypothetical protein